MSELGEKCEGDGRRLFEAIDVYYGEPCDSAPVVHGIEADPVPQVCLVANSPGSDGSIEIEMLADGGSNVFVINNADLLDGAVQLDMEPRQCSGAFAGAGTRAMGRYSLTIDFGATVPLVQMECDHMPDARHCIMPESRLYDACGGARVLKEPEMCIRFPSGQEVPLKRRNGLYYTAAKCGQQPV